MTFPGRRITLPIVLDDRWNREALERYMQSTRDKAVYLPSNIQYLADNNGLENSGDALRKLVQSDWVRVISRIYTISTDSHDNSLCSELDSILLVPFWYQCVSFPFFSFYPFHHCKLD